MTLADWLKRERSRVGLTQPELALASGVPIDTIRGIEQGKSTNPTLGVFLRLHGALGFDANEAAEELRAIVGLDDRRAVRYV